MQATVPPLVYVENKPNVARIYRLDEEAVRSALGAQDEVQVVVRDADQPDLAALAVAEYFIGSGFDPRRLAQHGHRLRVVHCTSAGVERYLPLDWLGPNTVLTNSSGIHAEKGGTFGCMAILMLNEGVPRHSFHQREHRWVQTTSTSIPGKTVLIHGLGSLGQAVAERTRRFGVHIIGTRRSGASVACVDEVYRPDALAELLPRADFLVLTCPLTDETRGSIGRQQLALLRAGAGVVNMARAAVMDYAALASELASGRLSGAILDVFDPEPLPAEAPWWDVPGLMVMPHVSSDDAVGYMDRCLAIFAENIRRERSGRPLTNMVDRLAGY